MARGDLAIAKSRLEQNEDQLARTNILAPYDGIVVERLMMRGERVVVGSNVVRLVDQENLEVIARADWVIDLGPEAADAGGTLMAEGPPEAVAAEERSHTGRYLRTFFERGRAAATNGERREGDRFGDEQAG